LAFNGKIIKLFILISLSLGKGLLGWYYIKSKVERDP